MSSGEDDAMSDDSYDSYVDYDLSAVPKKDAPLPDESWSGYQRSSSSEEGGDSAVYPLDDRVLDEGLIRYINSEASFESDLFANKLRPPPTLPLMPGKIGDLNREIFSICEKSRMWVNQLYRCDEVLPKIPNNEQAWDAKNEAYTKLMKVPSRLKALITRMSLLDGSFYTPPETLWNYFYFFWHNPDSQNAVGLPHTPEPYYAAPDFDTMYVNQERKKLKYFDDEEGLTASVAERTVELSAKFVKERGAFTVVLSGGSLVKALRKLVQPPYLDAVDWNKWHIFFLDERMVPKGNADSIYKLTCDEFLSKVPIPSDQVYAIDGTLSAEGASELYESQLRELVNKGVIGLSPVTTVPRFDLILMGMGSDGHVASLFPGHAVICEKEKWITFVKDSPEPPAERITFTLPVINASANIYLMVTGVDKAGAVDKAHSEHGSTSVLLPIQMVSLQDGDITWFTDKPAVSILFRTEADYVAQVCL